MFTRGFSHSGPRVNQQDFKRVRATSAIRGFDIHHQLWRLRNVKHLQDAEVELIMRTLVNAVQTYDQVVEVRCCCASFDLVRNSSLDPWTAAPLTDPSVHRWSPPPELRAVSPAGSRARPNCRSFHTITHVSGEFVDHTVRFFRRSLLISMNACMQVGVQFLQALNHFQRYAYVRQAHARESRGSNVVRDPSGANLLAPTGFSRTPSHRSELNLSAG
jgi:hypothetical protein